MSIIDTYEVVPKVYQKNYDLERHLVTHYIEPDLRMHHIVISRHGCMGSRASPRKDIYETIRLDGITVQHTPAGWVTKYE